VKSIVKVFVSFGFPVFGYLGWDPTFDIILWVFHFHGYFFQRQVTRHSYEGACVRPSVYVVACELAFAYL
jgi:hypothetical protein